jgi:LysR family cys regulon transcriptional activator
MTLLQLKILREIERQSLNISAAAKALNTTQPGVSRQIQMLERELGVTLLVRKYNRIIGLTPVGKTILGVAKSILNQATNIELLANEAQGRSGRLVIATTQLHARYTLLRPFKALQKKYPQVKMLLFQAGADDIPGLVSEHEADIGVKTGYQHNDSQKGVIFLQGDVIRRVAIMLRKHPLARKKRLSIPDLASHPLVGYNPGSSGGNVLAEAFKQSGVVPNVIVQANDSFVIKAYVSEGLGIGIVPAVTLDRRLDTHLHWIDVTALFPPANMNIIIRDDMHLPSYVREFIQMIAPAWKPQQK